MILRNPYLRSPTSIATSRNYISDEEEVISVKPAGLCTVITPSGDAVIASPTTITRPTIAGVDVIASPTTITRPTIAGVDLTTQTSTNIEVAPRLSTSNIVSLPQMSISEQTTNTQSLIDQFRTAATNTTNFMQQMTVALQTANQPDISRQAPVSRESPVPTPVKPSNEVVLQFKVSDAEIVTLIQEYLRNSLLPVNFLTQTEINKIILTTKETFINDKNFMIATKDLQIHRISQEIIHFAVGVIVTNKLNILEAFKQDWNKTIINNCNSTLSSVNSNLSSIYNDISLLNEYASQQKRRLYSSIIQNIDEILSKSRFKNSIFTYKKLFNKRSYAVPIPTVSLVYAELIEQSSNNPFIRLHLDVQNKGLDPSNIKDFRIKVKRKLNTSSQFTSTKTSVSNTLPEIIVDYRSFNTNINKQITSYSDSSNRVIIDIKDGISYPLPPTGELVSQSKSVEIYVDVLFNGSSISDVINLTINLIKLTRPQPPISAKFSNIEIYKLNDRTSFPTRNIVLTLQTKQGVANIIVKRKHNIQVQYFNVGINGFEELNPHSGIKISGVNNQIELKLREEINARYDYRFFVQDVYGAISEPLEVFWDGNKNDEGRLVRDIKEDTTIKKYIDTSEIGKVVDFISTKDGIEIDIRPTINNFKNVAYFKIYREPISVYGGVSFAQQTVVDDNNNSIFFITYTYTKQGNTLLKEMNPVIVKDKKLISGCRYIYTIVAYNIGGTTLFAATGFKTVFNKVEAKAPRNVSMTKIRSNPDRFLIHWDDENTYKNELNQVDNKDYFYKIKRADAYGTVEQFITRQNYLIDEQNNSQAFYTDGATFNLKFRNPSVKKVFTKTEVLQLPEIIALKNTSADITINKSTQRVNIPPFLGRERNYVYQVSVMRGDFDTISPYSEVLKLNTQGEVVAPQGLTFSFPLSPSGAKIKPVRVNLNWSCDNLGVKPLYFLIERKLATATDRYVKIGKVYCMIGDYNTEKFYFIDDTADVLKKYLYKVSSINFFEDVDRYLEIGVNT